MSGEAVTILSTKTPQEFFDEIMGDAEGKDPCFEALSFRQDRAKAYNFFVGLLETEQGNPGFNREHFIKARSGITSAASQETAINYDLAQSLGVWPQIFEAVEVQLDATDALNS